MQWNLPYWTPPNSDHFAYRATFTIPKNTHNCAHLKADRFVGPTSTWTVQNSIDVGYSTQDCPALLIDSATGH